MNIQIHDLRKTFGQTIAVDIPAFDIESGTLLGLVGNNGAGKSTLFRLILDLIKADAGYVLSGTTDVSRSEEWKDYTAAFIDESFLIDYLTPDEYFQFIAQLIHLSPEELAARLAPYEPFMAGEVMGQEKLIRTLSAGNKQKTGIVAAMLLRPKVLILDEPFNFLDPTSQNAIKRLLVDYNRETHATILVSSHNLAHTLDIASQIALMEHGHLLRVIDPHDEEAVQGLEEYFA